MKQKNRADFLVSGVPISELKSLFPKYFCFRDYCYPGFPANKDNYNLMRNAASLSMKDLAAESSKVDSAYRNYRNTKSSLGDPYYLLLDAIEERLNFSGNDCSMFDPEKTDQELLFEYETSPPLQYHPNDIFRALRNPFMRFDYAFVVKDTVYQKPTFYRRQKNKTEAQLQIENKNRRDTGKHTSNIMDSVIDNLKYCMENALHFKTKTVEFDVQKRQILVYGKPLIGIDYRNAELKWLRCEEQYSKWELTVLKTLFKEYDGNIGAGRTFSKSVTGSGYELDVLAIRDDFEKLDLGQLEHEEYSRTGQLLVKEALNLYLKRASTKPTRPNNSAKGDSSFSAVCVQLPKSGVFYFNNELGTTELNKLGAKLVPNTNLANQYLTLHEEENQRRETAHRDRYAIDTNIKAPEFISKLKDHSFKLKKQIFSPSGLLTRLNYFKHRYESKSSQAEITFFYDIEEKPKVNIKGGIKINQSIWNNMSNSTYTVYSANGFNSTPTFVNVTSGI